MNVYIKIHQRSETETVACCDEPLLNKVFEDGDLKLDVSNQFYGGSLIKLEEAIEILKQASFFNIVGEFIVNKAIACKLLHEEGVLLVNGVPMALKMMF